MTKLKIIDIYLALKLLQNGEHIYAQGEKKALKL